MQAKYVVTQELKNYLCECFPEKSRQINNDDLSFLFVKPYLIDFPRTESKDRVKAFKAHLQDLLDKKDSGKITPAEEQTLKKMMVRLYVYEMVTGNTPTFKTDCYSVLNYAPPIFGLQEQVIRYRIQNKAIFNKIHKYYYRVNYHNSIYAKTDPTVGFKNPALYGASFRKTHISSDESFELLRIPKTPIPGSYDRRPCVHDSNIIYESEYFVGEYNGKKVLFCRQTSITKDAVGTGADKTDKISVSLLVCLNGNPARKVCLLRYDYNPTDPHVNRLYYSKTTNQLTINTTEEKNYKSELATQLENGRNSHLHKYDEDVAYLFPGKSAENMSEERVKNFKSAREVVDWFDAICNINIVTKPPVTKKIDNRYGE